MRPGAWIAIGPVDKIRRPAVVHTVWAWRERTSNGGNEGSAARRGIETWDHTVAL